MLIEEKNNKYVKILNEKNTENKIQNSNKQFINYSNNLEIKEILKNEKIINFLRSNFNKNNDKVNKMLNKEFIHTKVENQLYKAGDIYLLNKYENQSNLKRYLLFLSSSNNAENIFIAPIIFSKDNFIKLSEIDGFIEIGLLDKIKNNKLAYINVKYLQFVNKDKILKIINLNEDYITNINKSCLEDIYKKLNKLWNK